MTQSPSLVYADESLVSSENKIIETDTCEAFFKDKIVYIDIKEDAVIDFREAKLQFLLWNEMKEKLVQKHAYGLVIDLRKMKNLTPQARMFYAKSSDRQGIGLALVTGSVFSVFTANFFLNFNRGRQHVKLFTNEEKALAWIKGILHLDDKMKTP